MTRAEIGHKQCCCVEELFVVAVVSRKSNKCAFSRMQRRRENMSLLRHPLSRMEHQWVKIADAQRRCRKSDVPPHPTLYGLVSWLLVCIRFVFCRLTLWLIYLHIWHVSHHKLQVVCCVVDGQRKEGRLKAPLLRDHGRRLVTSNVVVLKNCL